jgi:hypothetical protein
MRPLWKKVVALAFLSFLALWLVGVIQGATLSADPAMVPVSTQNASFFENPSSRLQVANNLKQLGMARLSLPLVLEQAEVGRIEVYEQSASLSSSSDTFDAATAHIRTALEKHQARIFNERNAGLAPRRLFTLELGVHPDRFESLVDELREIGHLDSISVQKRDRTGELRRLHAQRQSLKKHLEAVQKVRVGNNPSIDDTLKVEQKIQDIEKELQALSVQLGELLGTESFYQIYLTLTEKQSDGLARPAALPRRVLGAFWWALAWWSAAAGTLGVLGAAGLSVRTLWRS